MPRGRVGGGNPPARPEETLFEAVAETVFRQYERLWKPGSLEKNRNYLKNRLPPHFAGRAIAAIDAREVQHGLERTSRRVFRRRGETARAARTGSTASDRLQ